MHQQHLAISLMLIQKKALGLYEDLKCKNDDLDDAYIFTSSNGWFQKFKECYKLQNVNMTGEIASADTEEALNFIKSLSEIIKKYKEKLFQTNL